MFGKEDEDGVDRFEDFTQDNDKAGIFEGAGRDDYEGLKESVNPKGLRIRMSCRRCNLPHDITLEWKELFAVGSNGPEASLLLPPGWQYSQNNNSAYPATTLCSRCRTPLCPQVTPDEARRRVNDAIHMGFIPRPQAEQWRQEIAAYRAQNG